ncbi:MAG: hypothetical protein J5912_09100 [Clostridia bacterium]|nr:hypothetical protein [Clostridia bacterium]
MKDDISYTYTFCPDDFTSLEGFSEKDGVISHSATARSFLKTGKPYAQNQAAYSVDVKFGGDASFGILYRASNTGDDGKNAFIIDGGGSRAGVRMQEYTDVVTYGQTVNAAPGKWHTLKCVLNGSYGEFFVDGELLFRRCDIASGASYIGYFAEKDVEIKNIKFDNKPFKNDSWGDLLEAAALERSGKDRFRSGKFEYYQCGIGKTNLYVGTDGFTSRESYAERPGDIPDYSFDPMLVYDYWWDGTTRLAPFVLKGGYESGGKIYSGATGDGWSQKLDVATGTVTTSLECSVNGKTVRSVREVFVTEDGTVCYAIKSDTGLPFVFGIEPREEGYRVYRYEYDLVDEGQYRVSYEVTDGVLLATAPLATDVSNKAYLAVKAVSGNGRVSCDGAAGTVTVEAPKDSTFYIFVSPASDLSPDGCNARELVEKASASYEKCREDAGKWWSDFWSRGRISVPDKGLAVWFIRSQYYQAAALATARVPAGCFSTNIDGFFGDICFEYDMMFSMTSLQRTGHTDICDNVENWIRTYYGHSLELAQTGGLFGDVDGASVLCGLMGYDLTPCESWSLRENWHATHGGMNIVSFLFRNAAFRDEEPVFARTVLGSQLKMMETAFVYDAASGGYVHTGIWSPSEEDFFKMSRGDTLQSESAYWALLTAARNGIDARSPEDIFRRGFNGPDQASPALLSYYWQPSRPLDGSFTRLLDSILGGSSFSYHFNRAWAAALCARANYGEISEKLVRSMLDTDSVLYDDTYMCESTYNRSDYKRAPELGAHGAFSDALSLMLFDAEDENDLKFFAAIPETYVENGCSFESFSAYGGLTVSGSISAGKTVAVISNGSSSDKTRAVYLRVPAGSASVTLGELSRGCFAKTEVTIKSGETVTLEVSGSAASSVAAVTGSFAPVFPLEGETGISALDAAFCWTVPDNASRFVLKIFNAVNLSNAVFEREVDCAGYVNGIMLPTGGYRTDFYWCVYAVDGQGNSLAEMEGGPVKFTTAGAAEEGTVFGIDFESEGDVEFGEDSISISIAPGAPYRMNAAYFEPKQQDNFTVTFRISDYFPDTNHQQIGLYIAETSDFKTEASVWGKFMRTFSSANIYEFYGTDGSWENGGTAQDRNKTDSAYMKMELKDGVFTFSVSEDGQKWARLGKCRKTFDGDIIIAFSGATYSAADASATISEVSVVYE